MAQKSVKDSTGRTYASALNSLRRVLVVLRGSANADPLTITKDELAEVLANMAEQGVGCAGTIRAALKKEARRGEGRLGAVMPALNA